MAMLLLALALCGCVPQFSLRTDSLERPSTVPTVGPGSSLQQGASVSVQANNSTGALLVGAGIAAAVAGAWRGEPGLSSRTPALDPARRVEERDCTQPLDGLSGNLRCR